MTNLAQLMPKRVSRKDFRENTTPERGWIALAYGEQSGHQSDQDMYRAIRDTMELLKAENQTLRTNMQLVGSLAVGALNPPAEYLTDEEDLPRYNDTGAGDGAHD